MLPSPLPLKLKQRASPILFFVYWNRPIQYSNHDSSSHVPHPVDVVKSEVICPTVNNYSRNSELSTHWLEPSSLDNALDSRLVRLVGVFLREYHTNKLRDILF